jgi:hypothetical protein
MSDDAFNGACPTYSTRECPQRNQRWKRMGRLRAQNMATMRSRKMEGAGRRGFVRQTKLNHTLGVSIAISILSGDGRLEGLLIWWREETSMGERAVGREPITLQSAGPWTVDGSEGLYGTCDQQPRLDDRWRCRRRGWLHPWPSHAPRRPD